ncbi:DUF4351 domain-containing protein [Gloeobacter violaceus]|uniref:Glr3811 protein n=1 Tax=Gloeobacter violaceus (strain ATCC 29082 / PCC 7421) TaxID=251221 RepID=Q7NER7_GLOVI|nr:DUF4351 domain-containing protein [Gloeobacter violaceus]BAC91752.1 glr3811 [Gloeobacter violaceus PCC 7421]
MADYYIRLMRLYREPLREVEQFIVLLKRPSVSTTIQEEYRTGRMVHRYRVVRLWEKDPVPLLQRPALLPLAALARTDSAEALLERVAERIGSIEEPGLRANTLGYAKILAGLRFSEAIIDALLREELMRESVIYQRILREGEQRGREEGREEGRAQEARNIVLRQLVRRIGTLEASEREQVEGLSVDQLERLGEALLDFNGPESLSQWLSER